MSNSTGTTMCVNNCTSLAMSPYHAYHKRPTSGKRKKEQILI
uniref:Uncharacterized protein n=1 Tax=Arundo donax TaxID=35708 RepID=A0A0A8YWG7_ARUDO